MEEKNLVIADIPAEKFEFAENQDFKHDAKFDTKPVGYFKDAFRRFRKNKGSVVAGIILLILLAYALIVPIASSNVAKYTRDSYYAKLGPRTTWGYNIGINGSSKKEYNENVLLNYYSIGVGAEYHYDEATGQEHFADFAEGSHSYYQPVIKNHGQFYVQQGSRQTSMYTANVDAYLQVGFAFQQLSYKEYTAILNYQEKTGLQVLYPMIDTENEDYYGYGTTFEYPNYWYKASSNRYSKGAPLDHNGKTQSLANGDVEFIDIYLRDAEGKPVFYVRNGGGTAETAGYKVRVLYYNYYRYLNGVEPSYLLGTDSQGYDMAYRLATGMRLSFGLAILVSLINFIIGAIYGAIEGYYGGAIDLVLERISDILASVPFVVVATLFQLHIAKQVGGFISLLFAFVMTGWIGTASRVRSQFYRFKNSEYVLAARTLGASDGRIMWKHIFPNSLGTLVTSSVLVIPGVIFSESMLSYLGIVNLGSSTSTSLGTLLSESSTLWNVGYPNLLLIPAFVISLLMICFNLFGNGLRDAFNPTLRGADE